MSEKSNRKFRKATAKYWEKYLRSAHNLPFSKRLGLAWHILIGR